MTLDLTSDLPDATPAAVRGARQAAGLTQAQAAQLVDLGHLARWSEYERGQHQIDRGRWALFLLATGQHPRAAASLRRADTPTG